ncbi:baculoviral IAP repeat-containing protein 7-B-like isoform X2 [Dysidea avara]|uniref:baculoviral IAP repeat-containing protein 7-B-like isoform X2 n=1 Tax=Dysidea avara TaxID=196820 RepID=UPI00332DF553
MSCLKRSTSIYLYNAECDSRSAHLLQLPSDGSKSVAHFSDPSNGTKLKYDQMEDRSKTFTLPPPWEGPVNAHSMSEAGFVYTGQEDLVFCFSCNIKLDGWTKQMDPLLRHKEESPTCSFVRQQLQVIKGEKGKLKSVVAPSKPLNPRQTASISQLQLQSSTLFSSRPIHTVVTGLDESRLSYATSRGSELGDDYSKMYLPITVENYRLEEERLKSFVGWPLNESVHPEQLARVGFVYTGEGSLVQCFQCGVRYRNWLKGDIPLSVHQRCNPRCAFLHTLTSKTKPTLEKPNRSHVPDFSIDVPNEIVTLEFPDYTDQATRLQSFKYWGGVLPKEELAEAGFYMIARRDVVRCFSCHVVLQDWEKTDNVIDEHRRHNPECSFLKGHLYQSSLGNITSVTESSVEVPVTLQSGLDRIQIQSSKEILRKSKAKSPNSPGQPSGILYPPSWVSDPPHNIVNESGEDALSTESLGQKNDDYAMMTSLHTISNSKQIVSSGVYFEESLSQEMENNINVKISEGRDDDDDTSANSGLCQICFDKKIECIFLPCGHAKTCEECATRIKNSGKPCPYCRKSVSTTHRIYL